NLILRERIADRCILRVDGKGFRLHADGIGNLAEFHLNVQARRRVDLQSQVRRVAAESRLLNGNLISARRQLGETVASARAAERLTGSGSALVGDRDDGFRNGGHGAVGDQSLNRTGLGGSESAPRMKTARDRVSNVSSKTRI